MKINTFNELQKVIEEENNNINSNPYLNIYLNEADTDSKPKIIEIKIDCIMGNEIELKINILSYYTKDNKLVKSNTDFANIFRNIYFNDMEEFKKRFYTTMEDIFSDYLGR